VELCASDPERVCVERMLEAIDGPALIAAGGNGGVASAEPVPAAQSELESLQESMTRLLGMVRARVLWFCCVVVATVVSTRFCLR